MPEGDSLHRAAHRLQVLVGERVEVETPNPRAQVKRLAERLDGRVLESVEAVGKNLLLRFEGGLTLCSHLRMTGRWRVYRRGTLRSRGPWLVLRGREWEAAQWNGPVLSLSAAEASRVRRLGPGRAGAVASTSARPLTRLRAGAAERPLGEALQDQRLVAGIGNMWMAEAAWDGARLSLAAGRGGDGPTSCARCSPPRAQLMGDVAARRRRARRAVYRRAGMPCRRCGDADSVAGPGRRQPHCVLVSGLPARAGAASGRRRGPLGVPRVLVGPRAARVHESARFRRISVSPSMRISPIGSKPWGGGRRPEATRPLRTWPKRPRRLLSRPPTRPAAQESPPAARSPRPWRRALRTSTHPCAASRSARSSCSAASSRTAPSCRSPSRSTRAERRPRCTSTGRSSGRSSSSASARSASLPDAALALDELRREPAAADLRARTRRAAARTRAWRSSARSCSRSSSPTAEACGGFDWDDVAFDPRTPRSSGRSSATKRAYAAVAPLVGISIGRPADLADAAAHAPLRARASSRATGPRRPACCRPTSGARSTGSACSSSSARSRLGEEPPDAARGARRRRVGDPARHGRASRGGPVLFERLDGRPFGIRPVLPIAATQPPGEPIAARRVARPSLPRELLAALSARRRRRGARRGARPLGAVALPAGALSLRAAAVCAACTARRDGATACGGAARAACPGARRAARGARRARGGP